MDFFPKRFPLFGGQRIDFFINEENQEKNEELIKENTHLYVELRGSITNHLMNLRREKNTFYCFMPANDKIENKEIFMYQVNEHEDTTDFNIHTIFSGSLIEYFDDRIDEYSNLILQNLNDEAKLTMYLKELRNYSINLINNDQSLENFDVKLAAILNHKLIGNPEKNILHNIPQLSLQNLMKILDLNCLSYTKEMFSKIIKNEKLEPPDGNFIFEITDETAYEFSEIIFLKEFSNEGLFYLSSTIYMEGFSTEEKIATLKDFINEYTFMTNNQNVITPQNQKYRSKSMNRCSPLSKSNHIEIQICDLDDNPKIFEESNMEELVSSDDNDLPNKISGKIKSIDHLKIEKTSLPSRSSSDKYSGKRNLSFENLQSFYTPESGISLEIPKESVLLNQKQTMKSFLSESNSPENINEMVEKSIKDEDPIVSDTGKSEDVVQSEDQLFSINEFIKKQYEQVAKDTSFIIGPKSHASPKNHEGKKRFTALTHIFKKDKKNSKKTDSTKANLRINVTKSISSSTNDVKRHDSASDNKLQSPATSEHSISITENQEEMFPEAETWSEIADPKVMKKLTTKEIRKQDVIFETIKSEYYYLKTLKTMYNIYYKGLIKELKIPQEKVDILIPRITDLSAIHGTILATWRQLQNKSENMVIESMGDSFIFQFSDMMAKKIVEVYGFICSNQTEASETYEEIMNEKKFRDFMESCRKIQYLRRLSLKECQTLIAQRMVKYPILIERILDNTKESDKEFEKLKTALKLSRDVVKNINLTVTNISNQKALLSYQQRADNKSEYVNKNNEKIKLSDLLSDIELKNVTHARFKHKLKFYDIILACANKYLLLLVDNNPKISLFSIDKKNPIIIYRNSMVRVSAADPKSLFLLDQKNTDFYEICFNTDKDCSTWSSNFNQLRAQDELLNHENDQKTSIEDQKEFKNIIENLSNQTDEIVKIFKNIIAIMTNIYQFLLKKCDKKDEKKPVARFSLADDSWWEKSMCLELQSLLKINPQSHPDHTPSPNNGKPMVSYRGRTRTINVIANALPSVPGVSRTESSSRLPQKHKLKEQHTICNQINEILVDLSKEENFLKIIKSKLTSLDPKIKLVVFVDKAISELNSEVNSIFSKITDYKNNMQSLSKKYEMNNEKLDKETRTIFHDRVAIIKTKINELSLIHK